MCEDFDSADDEMFEKYSVDSLECSNADSTLKAMVADRSNVIVSTEPFRLHEDPALSANLGYSQMKLEKESGINDGRNHRDNTRLTWNCEIDEGVLMSKGLQLNEDGSFSKSPRGLDEELPFVMSAPRVAQIRRKKEILLSKKPQGRLAMEPVGLNTRERRSLLNMSFSLENKAGGVSVTRSSSFVPRKDLSRYKTSANLTDSMKEALFKTYQEKRQLVDEDEPRERRWNLPAAGNVTGVVTSGISNRSNKPREKNRSEELVKIPRNPKKILSEWHLPKLQRQRLSYYERFLKEKGFDPRGLKDPRPLRDSDRSNCGGSARESLSDVSSRCPPIELDEGEEQFYHQIIEEDKRKMNGGAVASCKNEMIVPVPRDEIKEKTVVGTNRIIGLKKRTKNCASLCSTTPSLASNRSGKCQHLCPSEVKTLPKAELAHKARAYGNLANKRNIAKLQFKSQSRDPSCGRTDNNDSQCFFPSYMRQLNEMFTLSSVPRVGPPRTQSSFLPHLPKEASSARKPTEAQLPWETKNLLMQITAEKELFLRNMRRLKNMTTDNSFGAGSVSKERS